MNTLKDMQSHSKSVYDTYCIKPDKSLLIGDPAYLHNVCSNIAVFANDIFGLIDGIDSRSHTRSYGGPGNRFDTTYTSLEPICRMSTKCDAVFRSQKGFKNLIPQLTHIVSEFGLLLPLGINNLKHRRDEYRLDPDPHKPKQRILNKWAGKRATEHIFGHPPSVYLAWKEITNWQEMISLLKRAIQDKLRGSMNIQQMWIDKVYTMIDTVKKLRYIDLTVCHQPGDPMTPVNIDHADVYNALEMVIRAMDSNVQYLNAKRVREGLSILTTPVFPHRNLPLSRYPSVSRWSL